MNSQLLADQQLAKLYFVLRAGHSSNENASEDMKMAYSTAREHNDNEELQGWITEEECLKMDEESLTKRHVFVFEKFTGTAFEHARKSPSTVIGPRCLISCFMDNETIPLGVHPVYTTAMRNLTVCSSGLKAKDKSLVSQLLYHMGGYYLDVLNASCTHLVSSTVKSVKYEKAAECKLPIMHPDWVSAVWEESQRRDLHATEPSIIEQYRLPVFYALTITSTGLTAARKNEIKALIESNGGNYVGSFKSETTDILILEKTGTESAKFRGAVRCNKECLTPEWVVDSAASGYVLPVREYEVKSLKASTPTKGDEPAVSSGNVGIRMSGGQFNPDCTQLSEISHANFSSRNETINESIISAGDGILSSGTVVTRLCGAQRYREVLARMTVQQAKKAGHVLDGCNVFLSGFTGDEKEKLNKILNSVGAVRYDEISSTISHVIVGEQHVSELAKFRDSTAHLLTVEWLAKSIELRQLAPEEASEYAFQPSGKGIVDRAPEPPSPSSKKNLQRMNSSVFKRPDVPKFRLEDATPAPGPSKAPPAPKQPSEVDSIMLQYMEKNTAERLPVSSGTAVESKPSPGPGSITSGVSQMDSELESQFSEFMLGKTLFVFGFSEEDAVQILSDCKECGGTIVDESYTDEVDYIVLPTSCIGTPDFAVRGRLTVNCIWLETSIQNGQCCPMEYYYEPIIYGEDDPTPLEGETVVISSYSGPERDFLNAMGKVLGACVQERFVRKAAPLLVCKEASGAKYNAAIQWDLTVVRAEWLRECFRLRSRVAENTYLVGDAICSAKNIPVGAVGGCLPTTSTDDVDIDSVREDAHAPPRMDEAKDEEPSMLPQASSTMKPLAKPTKGGDFQYITRQQARDETELQYGFKRLTTPQLRKMTNDERMVYSQEMDQYEDLIKAQRAQRKPFDPNEGTVVPGVMESPAGDVLRTRRFTAISEEEGRGSSASRSPITPVGGSRASSTNITPVAGEYEAMSVTQRVMEFDTPIRTTLYKVLKDAEEADSKITPRTRRVKELLATPQAGPATVMGDGHIRTPTLPECMTKPVTPYGFRPDASPDNHAYHKRKLQHWDRYYKSSTSATAEGASGPSDQAPVETASQKARRLSTPISEIKRRFYVEKFGDEYANHIQSKCTTVPRRMQDLNRSGEESDPEEEIASTAPQPRGKDASPAVITRSVPAAGSHHSADSSSTSLSRGSLERSNTSAEKRSRSELEELDGEDNLDESDEKYGCPVGVRHESEQQQPAMKKRLLNEGQGEEKVQRFSDVIAAAKESAKKKGKFQLQPDTEIPPEHYTEMDYDSEINVGGVVWRERDIENIQANEGTKTPKGKLGDTSRDKSIGQESSTKCAPRNGMKYRGTPVFAISGVPENVRLELARKIEHLKGQLASDPNRYDPNCTHILCGKPNRGEKMLSGIAAGKWLLSTKYLDDSFEAGYFLDEESYEWGNPKAVGKLAALVSAGDMETAAAAYTWRTRIANDVGKHDGAFTGYRVLLVVPKKDQFERLLQSGGGYVLNVDPPFIKSECAMSATHCFVDRKAKLSSEDHRALAEAGIAVLSIMYLNAYLTSVSLPDPNNFQIPI
ncbi:DNA topoisomerase 2-binding protein 1-A [Anopheles moucheti]|uniref:DNA topoisomerase 2-binding protein 1-A n=1 Tax=Anopheles moucheti TaxID=186751 RepID=UPI0022F130DA|nr:DNA topoisomerase 2-binding protein 1-A [Anopheles moucheti]